ncbi:MAG: translation initiation factor IF-2 [Candidatus Koribacter versatilis]|uniref:Translation initiation factor IF-2 n=1 Tax=Candidatus Korobacter versatilis TaxID=658062 RepID=A0A932EPW0_9BACT|nr:translation initiation factor IF-2 [Candidatus Koribacter versatilis]
MKIRINDLARELEVKSKAILDVLDEVGVIEKKTHSSSLEADDAAKVRKHFAKSAGPSKSPASAHKAATADELKPKFDLSKISKPGDVLKAIQSKAAPGAAKPGAPGVAKPGAPVGTKPAAGAPKSVAPPEPPPAIKGVTPPTATVVPASQATPRPPAAGTPPAVAHVAGATPSAPQSATPSTAQAHAPTQPAVNPATAHQTPQPPPPPGPPARRVITPQTGPRPVYQAPATPRPGMPGAPSAAGGPRPGQPIFQRPQAMQGRPAPGRPMPGQPIFQRPRPGAPGSRPPLKPGERRLHPTRTSPTGVRPIGVGPGAPMAPPSGRPAGRPGGPARRPGQRYVPRGVKEGPMKGFVPPPRLALSNEPVEITRTIEITEGISVKDLAEKLDVRAKDVIARLLAKGVFASINQTLESGLATEMARQFGADTNVSTFEEQAAKEAVESGAEEIVVEGGGAARPPIVTIMGHVDHGKTTLLDSIRLASVAEGEAGGITQHIGAYKVKVSDKASPANGREITFIDTPGHEAFTRMRARGAKVTDIVVLVVAADDGVMPQTLEAIDHAQAAKVPLIVAVNKIDKPDAMPERVKKQLADRGLVPEDWGGTTVYVDVSAKQKTNLNLLLEMICLVADVQGLKAAPDRPANGVVLEAKLDRGRGAVATILVQNGTLRTGDQFVVGNTFGKVRAMFDDHGNAIDEAPPSSPAEVLGLEGLPQAGDQMVVVADRDKAKGIATYREQKSREAQLAKSSRVSLEGLAEQIKNAGVKDLPLIVKGDVQGSVEVLSDTLNKLSNEQVKIKVLHTGVGAITETDVLLASASNAIIIGFNVRPERKAQELAEQEQVDIRLHSIIYELQDEMKKAMLGLLEPIVKETYMGRADVKEVFRIPKVGAVAGCQVSDGTIKQNNEVRLLRDNVVVFKGKIGSLRRFKDDVSEVRNGMECGIAIANYGDVKKGDVIEAFVTEKIAAELTAQ